MSQVILLVLVLLLTSSFVHSSEEECYCVLLCTTAMDSNFLHPNNSISTELVAGYFTSAESVEGPNYFAGTWPSKRTYVSFKNSLESSTLLANCLVAFISYFKWTQVIIIADLSWSFYLRTAEKFYRMSSDASNFNFVQLRDHDSDILRTLRMIEHSRIGIIILSLQPTLIQKLLCARHLVNLTRPNLWITHSVDFHPFLKNCSENVVVFQQKNAMESLVSDNLNEETHFKFDRLVIISSDVRMNKISCYPLILTAQNISVVDIYQLVDQKPIYLTNYSVVNGLGHVTLSGQLPYDEYTPQFALITFIIICYLSIGACFILITVTLILYIFFRKESAIKASSVSLSMLIFIGCYLLMFYLAILNTTLLPGYHKRSNSIRNLVCIVRSWLHGMGYPTTLILSTLLVRLLRIYRLFNNLADVKKFECSNFSLFLYALLLTTPCILICLMWTTLDPYNSVVTTMTKDGYLHVSEECWSKHTKVWVISLLVYMLLLSTFVIVMTTLTRKIKYSNFKDTKKINGLSYILVFTLCVTFIYWYMFRVLNLEYLYIHSLLQLSHFIFVMEFQVFLIAPKLIPIIRERYQSLKKY